MSKLVKDLQDGDTVYVIEESQYKKEPPSRIIECKIEIKFIEHSDANGYKHIAFSGYLDSGTTKFWHGYCGQVIRVSTVCNDHRNISIKDFNKLSEKPGGVLPQDYYRMLDSTSFFFGSDFHVFTDLNEAKDYILDWKLKNIRADLAKTIGIKKYKPQK